MSKDSDKGRLTWIILRTLIPITSVLISEAEKDFIQTKGEENRREGNVNRRQKLELCGHKPRPRSPKDKEQIVP